MMLICPNFWLRFKTIQETFSTALLSHTIYDQINKGWLGILKLFLPQFLFLSYVNMLEFAAIEALWDEGGVLHMDAAGI